MRLIGFFLSRDEVKGTREEASRPLPPTFCFDTWLRCFLWLSYNNQKSRRNKTKQNSRSALQKRCRALLVSVRRFIFLVMAILLRVVPMDMSLYKFTVVVVGIWAYPGLSSKKTMHGSIY